MVPQPRIAGASAQAELEPEPALANPRQIGVAVAIWVICAFVVLPPIETASEATVQFHHLAHAVVAPALMLLAMVPGVYGGLDQDTAHAAYHAGLMALALLTGMAAAVLGRSTGKYMIALTVAMMLMYAGGVTGG